MTTQTAGGDEPWKAKAANKRAAEFAKIPPEWRLAPEFLKGNEHSDLNVLDVPSKCGLLTASELEITENFTAHSLAKAVQSGSVTASAVALAFCKRAAIAQQVTNCLTETVRNRCFVPQHARDSLLTIVRFDL